MSSLVTPICLRWEKGEFAPRSEVQALRLAARQATHAELIQALRDVVLAGNKLARAFARAYAGELAEGAFPSGFPSILRTVRGSGLASMLGLLVVTCWTKGQPAQVKETAWKALTDEESTDALRQALHDLVLWGNRVARATPPRTARRPARKSAA